MHLTTHPKHPFTLYQHCMSWALDLATHLAQSNHPLIIVVQSDKKAKTLQKCLEMVAPPALRGGVFTGYETLPYEMIMPSPAIVAHRCQIRHDYEKQKLNWVIMALPTLSSKLTPTSFNMLHNTQFHVGDQIDPHVLRQQWLTWGYVQDDDTSMPGTFAIRGGTIDVFPGHAKQAYRIELFDDTIENIYLKNNHAQQFSIPSIQSFLSHDALNTPNQRKAFEGHIDDYFDDPAHRKKLSAMVKKTLIFPGYQHFLPLYHDGLTSWLTIGQDAIWFFERDMHEAIAKHEDAVCQRFKKQQHLPHLAPSFLYLETQHIEKHLQSSQMLHDHASRIRAVSPAQQQKLRKSLREHEIPSQFEGLLVGLGMPTQNAMGILPHTMTSYTSSDSINLYQWMQQDTSTKVPLFDLALDASLIIDDQYLLIARDLFSSTHVKPQQKKATELLHDAPFQLYPGDYVVHRQHGIGEMVAYEHLGNESFCVIAYADDDKIYVPMTALHNLSPIHEHGNKLERAKLGSKKWRRQQLKAIQKIADGAVYLLGLYAKRASQKRPLYSIDQKRFDAFVEAFPFHDTEDQKKVTEAIVKDLTCSNTPMDRLICGDVGFGKTELAIRAAWLAVHAGYQVVFLAPTAILAQQHHTRLTQRFADTGIQLGLWLGTHSQNQILATKTAMQQIDILIGTHGLLSDKLTFKNLRLMIIDEEQKFGVKQKEKYKKTMSNLDLLTLSATPIPRTLHMTMSDMRDISLLATPPQNRIDIQTFVCRLSDDTAMKEAIQRETARGGQVYVCYNKIEALAPMKKRLSRWFPDLKITIGHGQMSKPALTEVMQSFYHHETDILLASSIIDAGLDHANANTMIVYRADLFGLSQLHQLRGRIGRSAHQGYAYFFIPEDQHLGKHAKERMAALKRFHKVGCGFSLALEDMEIRGTGHILGENQSGHVAQIGLAHYLELMEKTMTWLKKNPNTPFNPDEILNEKQVTVDYYGQAFIPESYLSDPQNRMHWYAQIAKAATSDKLTEILGTLYQQYGPLPEPLLSLIQLADLRCQLRTRHILKAQIKLTETLLTLPDLGEKQTEQCIQLTLDHPSLFKLLPENQLIIFQSAHQPLTFFDQLKKTLALQVWPCLETQP